MCASPPSPEVSSPSFLPGGTFTQKEKEEGGRTLKDKHARLVASVGGPHFSSEGQTERRFIKDPRVSKDFPPCQLFSIHALCRPLI